MTPAEIYRHLDQDDAYAHLIRHDSAAVIRRNDALRLMCEMFEDLPETHVLRERGLELLSRMWTDAVT